MNEKNKEYRIAGRPRTIYRVVKSSENPYVMIDRRPIDNPSLSFKAKGILTYLMARPDGWEVSVTDLVNHGADGYDSIRSGLGELKKAGHIKQTSSREKGRITGWLIEVYEIPDVENPDVENPDVENPIQVLSNSNNKVNKINSSNVNVTTAKKIYETYKAETLTGWNKRLGTEVSGYPSEWIKDAVFEAAAHNVLKWQYVLGVLKNWKDNGKTSV